jgi:hypothetical protein
MSDTSVFCETCDDEAIKSAKAPGFRQCYECLRHRVKPCVKVPKFATHTDLAVAMAEIARYRAEWEQLHEGWVLVPDYQAIWPESAPPSRHADYGTTMGRKRVEARWVVERRHPRGAPVWLRPFQAFLRASGYTIGVDWGAAEAVAVAMATKTPGKPSLVVVPSGGIDPAVWEATACAAEKLVPRTRLEPLVRRRRDADARE